MTDLSFRAAGNSAAKRAFKFRFYPDADQTAEPSRTFEDISVRNLLKNRRPAGNLPGRGGAR